jgi:imidazoleglycerol-phosphate dehydratase
VREFLLGLSSQAKIALHAHCRYGENSHHMVEALFKALGRAVKQAYTLRSDSGDVLSTKGIL